MHNNEEEKSLDKYEGEGKAERYVTFFFIALFLPSQKESNSLTNLSEKTKNLNHLVYILKICYSEKC